MMNLCGQLYFLSALAVLGIHSENKYFITAPNALLSESKHNFTVYVSIGTALVIETVHPASEIVHRSNVTVLRKGHQTVPYIVPFIGSNIESSLIIRFLGDVCSSDTMCRKVKSVSGKFISRELTLDIIVNNFIIFSETDKPIYKPGDIVKLRAMVIYTSNMMQKPQVSGPCIEISLVNGKYHSTTTTRGRSLNFDSITIETPDNVKMAQWLNVSFDQAMMLTFPLSKDPTFGRWKIKIVRGGLSDILTFTVKKYVLPRFLVDLYPPTVILQSDKNITFKVCASYSTGKTMQALIHGELCIQTNRLICRPFASLITGGTNKCSQISIDGAPFGLRGKDTIYYSLPSTIKVTVTENGTTHEVKKVAQGSNIKYVPYEIKFLSKSYFKPGLPYFGKVKLERHDGTPQRNTKVEFSMEVAYRNNWGFKKDYVSNIDGIIDFTIPYIPIKDQVSLNIKGISDEATSAMLQPSMSTVLINWVSVDEKYIDISLRSKVIKCPGNIPLLLVTNGDVSSVTIYVQLFSRGLINKMIEYPPVPLKCTNRDDDIGHYECTNNNRLKCLQGWQGGNCREPICQNGCGKGACVRPGVCVCMSGWTGSLCDQCVRAKFCINGFCRDGNDCVCLPGWSGYRCENKGPIIHRHSESVKLGMESHTPKPVPKYQNQTIFERFIDIPIEKDMGPVVHAVVYYINKGNEIIADSIEIKDGLKECSQSGGGKFEFNQQTATPREMVQLYLDPGTRRKSCALRISDIALSQFGQFGNINLDHLIGQLIILNQKITTKDATRKECFTKNGKIERSYNNYNDGYDSKRSFIKSGLTPITNYRVVNIKCYRRYRRYYRNIRRNIPDYKLYRKPLRRKQPPVGRMSKFKGNKLAKKVKEKRNLKRKLGRKLKKEIKKEIRDFFPETWIFDYYNVTPTQINLTVPDSMTTWKANSYCMTERGLWFAPSRLLTAVMPFFADIYLPYSIKMGERLQLPVKIFNYVDECYEINAMIYVNFSEIAITGPKSFTICVCSGDIKTMYFNIKAKVIGTMNVTIAAQSQYSSFCSNGRKQNKKVSLFDSIRRQLLVEAPGIPSELTFSGLICCKEEQIGLKGPHKIPTNIVAGSLRSYLVFNGDAMGQTFDNLDKMVKMPYGCGEQNMVALVPSIYVLDYLTNLNINDPGLVSKAKGYISMGYRRQLTYKHPDGSYSAFGKNDKSGNTWLTAFVLRSFMDASKYVSIDSGILKESKQYLQKMQGADGCFLERGTLLSSVMAGGVKNQGVTDSGLLTAYVLISLRDVNISLASNGMRKAIACVKSSLKTNSSPYRQALSGYALSIHDSQSRFTKALLESLQNISISSGRYKYWKSGLATSGGSSRGSINSADIETTGYALLALQNSQSLENSLSTIYWLSNQRNSLGGYYSTQDTIVALKAIAVIAEKIGVTEFKKISLDISLNDNKRHSETITSSDRLVTRKINVGSENITYISVQASGTGCVSVQLISLFNVNQLTSAKDEYKLEVKTILTDVMVCTKMEVRLCSSYLRKDRNSNMILITVDYPSGWILLDSKRNELLKQLINPLKRIDFTKNSMNLYYDSFTYSDEANERCVTFRLDQTNKVDNLKPTFIRMVDYYKPEIYTDITFAVPVDTCRKVNTTIPKPRLVVLCPKCITDSPDAVDELQSRLCPWSFTGIVKTANNTLKNRIFYEAKDQVFYEWTVELESSDCSCLKSWPHINEDFLVISSEWISLSEKLTFSNTSIMFSKNVLQRAFRSDLGNSCAIANNLYQMLTRVDKDFKTLTEVNKTCASCILLSNIYHKVTNMSSLICSKKPRWTLTTLSLKHFRFNGTLTGYKNVTIFVEASFPMISCFCLRQMKNLKRRFEIIDTNNVIVPKNNTAQKPLDFILDHKFIIAESGIFSQYNWTTCRN